MRLTFCCCCGEREADLHYYRIAPDDYDEAPTDVITLCFDCSMKLYGKQKKVRRKKGTAA